MTATSTTRSGRLTGIPNTPGRQRLWSPSDMSESDDSLDGAEGRTPSDKILTTSTTLGNLTTMRHKTSSWSSSEGSRSDPKTPSSGSPSGMSEQRDDLDELPYLTPYTLRLCKPKTGSAKFYCICRYNNCINFVLYFFIDTFYF